MYKTCEPREQKGPSDICVAVEVWAADHDGLEWGGNKPQEGLLCEGGLRDGRGAMFKDNSGVKF